MLTHILTVQNLLRLLSLLKKLQMLEDLTRYLKVFKLEELFVKLKFLKNGRCLMLEELEKTENVSKSFN
jgi:hypothetical protein